MGFIKHKPYTGPLVPLSLIEKYAILIGCSIVAGFVSAFLASLAGWIK